MLFQQHQEQLRRAAALLHARAYLADDIDALAAVTTLEAAALEAQGLFCLGVMVLRYWPSCPRSPDEPYYVDAARTLFTGVDPEMMKTSPRLPMYLEHADTNEAGEPKVDN